ncbi:ABC transporter ATP-binding protein [Aeromicrobium sp. Root495]|nr:ABC transporter ATP-binding protein [Aeromicrobium sp. Root495]
MPSSAIARGAKLASLPVGFAGRTALGMGRRLGGAPAEAVLTEVQRRTAEQIFSVLGQLKGGAMKFGQAMSVFEAALPDEIAGPYRETLTKLQDAAPPMPPGTVHRQLATELGEDWRDRLSIDDAPAASASIGQVHRGTWTHEDGREEPVAVKVQYPGAAKALLSDLKQLSRLSRLFAVVAPGLDVKPLLKELQERVAEELDYRLEADAQRTFAAEYADDPDFVVPTVVAGTERVLVSSWMDSEASLAEIISAGTQEDRDRYGLLFAQFLLSGPRRVGLLHADPHPGNFRIIGDGRLGVVDFGAVARLPEGFPPAIGPLLRRAIAGDAEGVSAGLREEGFLRPGVSLQPEVLNAFIAPFFEPATVDEFSFSRGWLRAQVQRVSAPGIEGMGTSLKINLPPEYLLIHRVWLGAIGVLSQLGATAPFRSILDENLPGFSDPD